MRLRTRDVQWGILGAGKIAGVFAADLAAAGLRVSAVAARDGARAESFARTAGIPRSHGSYRALVEGAGLVVSLDNGSVDPANDGRLVHISGPVKPVGVPRDDMLGISAEGAAGLERIVEMYQWAESSQSETRKQLGLYPDDGRYHQALQEREHERRRLREAIQAEGFSTGEGVVGIVSAAYGFLARTPCALLIVQMEDLALEREQPNVPGTGDSHPNWRRKLSRNLDDIFAASSTDMILDAVRKERPRGSA